MADKVRFIMDRMAITFRQMEESQVFTNEEVRAIVKRRTDFEYSLRRMEMTVATYEEYLQYEYTLDKLLEIRSKKLTKKVQEKALLSLLRGLKTASIRHIHYIYERGLRRFPNNYELWDAAINFLEKKQSNSLLDELLGKAIALHPKKIHFWIKTAEHELHHNNNIHAARVLMQRSLRINDTQSALWAAYFRLEIWNIKRAIVRQQKLGISKEGMQEIIPGLVAPAMVVFRYARDAILKLGDNNTDDLSMLFLMHNEAVALPIDQLSNEVQTDLLTNTFPLLTHPHQQQELLLHLVHAHILQYLQQFGSEILTLESVFAGLMSSVVQYYESLLQSHCSNSPSERTATLTAYLSRWVLRILRKILFTSTKAVYKASRSKNEEGESDNEDDSEEEDSDNDEEDDESSDSEEEEEEAEKEEEDDEKKAQKQQRKEQKLAEREAKRKLQLSPLAKRVRTMVDTAYTQRNQLLTYADVSTTIAHHADMQALLQSSLAKFLQQKDGKKWKKDTLAVLVTVFDSLQSSAVSTLSSPTATTTNTWTLPQAIHSMSLLQWISLMITLGWSQEKSVEKKWKDSLGELAETQVAGNGVMHHWQQTIETFARRHFQSLESSRKTQPTTIAHSGPRFTIIYQLQTWAALTMGYVSLTRDNQITNNADQSAYISNIRTALPRLAVWLIQPVPPLSLQQEHEEVRLSTQSASATSQTLALVDPTSLTAVTNSPGSALLVRFTQDNTPLYQQCVEQIVTDPQQIVSVQQREYWLIRALQSAVPTTEEWILLTDQQDILMRWSVFAEKYQQLMDQHRRQPHLFAQVNLPNILQICFDTVDMFLQSLEIGDDMTALFRVSSKQRKVSSKISDAEKEQLKLFVQGMVQKAVLVCPDHDGFLQRQMEMLRSLGKHEEANHVQFKRRRLT